MGMNKEYVLRETLLFIVQIVGIVGPAIVVVWQLLMLRPGTARLLPLCVAPLTMDKKQVRCQHLQSLLVERGCLQHILSRFDDIDFQHFDALLSNSSASVGIIGTDSKMALHPSVYLRKMLSNTHTDSAP